MTALLIILTTAIVYALIRAIHDSYLQSGKWKTWAFIEGVFVAITITGLSTLAFDMMWYFWPLLCAVFAFSFWLVFDCTTGYLFGGSILYLGSSGFDLKMRQTFKYDLPIFGWKSGSLIFILFKSFWLTLLILSYLSL